MRRMRNVKIVATLGPASDDYAMIRALHEAGADVFRLNMSHGTQDEIRTRHEIIRKVEQDLDSPIAILADLQGPKLRVGEFANPSEDLVEGAKFRLDLDEALGTIDRVRLPHPEIFAALEVGASLLVNDGKIRLKVLECGPDFADCEVVTGGAISNRKGVNVPDVVLPLAALSEKDLSDLEFACELGVDWVALSFVQRAKDVWEARELIKGRAAVLSKIEKPSAVDSFDEILDASDGIMVARGDLGVELPVQNVPPIQKRLVRKCRAAAKPVIVATQMLESMIESPMPTRAEVSDVATAIYEGADAIMLSAESAAGDYPIEAVTTMDNVAREVAHGRARICRRWYRCRRTRDCGNHGCCRDLLLYPKRHDGCADRPRTPARSDYRHDFAGPDRAACCSDLGHILRHHRRHGAFQERRGLRGPCRPLERNRDKGRPHRGHRRRAVQCCRHHKYPARCALRRKIDLRI
jgi:pyruvate kinase